MKINFNPFWAVNRLTKPLAWLHSALSNYFGRPLGLVFITFILSMALTSFPEGSIAQTQKLVVRVARLVIDPSQLESYKAALKEGIETAVRVEPGVLSLYGVYDKENPSHVTVFEIYADTNAYKAHLESPHFKKYKNATKDMVRSLELIDTAPIALEAKHQDPNISK